MREHYKDALKLADLTSANPNYLRLEVQRQQRGEGGQWSRWTAVDRQKNQQILDNIPLAEEEPLLPEFVYESVLVDNLPHLLAGKWRGVRLGKFQKKEQVARRNRGPGLMNGPPGGGMGMDMYKTQSVGPGGGGINLGMYGAAAGGSAASAVAENVAWKSEAKEVMVRALDFQPKPNQTLRYRARIVVSNPNRNRDDVMPGTDNKSEELAGPWSEPTNEVTVPPEVIAFAEGKVPPPTRSLTRSSSRSPASTPRTA